jgi:hypothetical protein
MEIIGGSGKVADSPTITHYGRRWRALELGGMSVAQ